MTSQTPSSQHTPPLVVAIDGPAASGKSTIGDALAKRLGFLFFDTGAMYRAVTQTALARDISIQDEAQVTRLAENLHIDVTAPTVANGRRYTVFVDGEDVTKELRSTAVDANVSVVSAYPGVRTAMMRQQRRIAMAGRVVMVGRDIGTVVMPEAPLKIYLDASLQERALRRFREQLGQKEPVDFETIIESMRLRDTIDSSRKTAPLRAAADALVINTDGMSVQEVVDVVEKVVRERLPLNPGMEQLRQ